jgi:3-methyl-2-oxobutanoate hydroxymethyltransferase
MEGCSMLIIDEFYKMKRNGDPIVMVTAYDHFSAIVSETSQVDIILVGDSLGNVIQGRGTTIGVTLEDMIYHLQIVRRAAVNTFIIADMPYSSYHIDLAETKRNAIKLMVETGADAVKLEGGSQSRIDAIKAIIDCEIPVCGHLGLTPQSIRIYGDYRVQARETEQQEILIEQAKAVESAGAFMLVLECIPEELGTKISQMLTIPVIGIGAGRYTDGQVLVWHDLLGMTDEPAKFVKQYINLKQICIDGVSKYKSEVKGKQFPGKINAYFPKKK